MLGGFRIVPSEAGGSISKSSSSQQSSGSVEFGYSRTAFTKKTDMHRNTEMPRKKGVRDESILYITKFQMNPLRSERDMPRALGVGGRASHIG